MRIAYLINSSIPKTKFEIGFVYMNGKEDYFNPIILVNTNKYLKIQQEVRKLVNDYSTDIISINKVLYKTSIEEGYQVSKIFCTKI